jgi:hypothetical protein
MNLVFRCLSICLVIASAIIPAPAQSSVYPPEPPAEMVLPDLQTMPPYDLRLLVSPDGERAVIRFSNSIWNAGPGELEVRGRRRPDEQVIQVWQVITRLDGSATERSFGVLEYHPIHEHWHWDGFSRYEVWSVDAGGKLGRLLATSGKVGYCLRDDETVLANVAGGVVSLPVYRGCGWQRQGISPGWMDTYDEQTEGQSLDISGLGDGEYALKSTVDPLNRILERDESNNAGVLFFTLSANRLVLIEQMTPLAG